MDLQITNDKAKEWVKQGAPNNALGYLGDTVKSMAEFAEQNDILHKDEPETNTDEQEETTVENIVEDSVDDADANKESANTEEDEVENAEGDANDSEDTSVDADNDTIGADFLASFGKSLNETITVAIKTYHDEVVIPLQKALEDITTKSQSVAVGGGHTNKMFEHLLGEDWLPASVVANTIKEQFASDNSNEGDETVSNTEVQQSTENVDKELSNGVGNSRNVPGHLFNEF